MLLFSGALIYSIRSAGSALPDGHERDLRIVNTAQSPASSGILFEDFSKTGATGCVQRRQHVSISSYVNSGFHTLPSTLPCACVCVSLFLVFAHDCLSESHETSISNLRYNSKTKSSHKFVCFFSTLGIFADVSGCMF